MRMDLRSRAVVLSSFGFALGMLLGVVITSISVTLSMEDGKVYLCVPEFTRFIGNELTAFLIQAILSGVYGAVGMGVSVVYSIEKWSLVKASVVHFFATVSMYFLVSGFLRWFSPFINPLESLIMLAIFVAIYVMIWSFNYISYKIQISKINMRLNRLKNGEVTIP